MASDKMLGSFDQKSVPEDNDLLVEYDASASKVKNVKFGGVWNWIVKKLTSAVINELQTSSKNVVGAINELNSKTFQYIDSVILDQALKTESILYTTNVKQLYISYGLKNKTQSYGGSTIIIFALEDKPCMVPVYVQNGTLIAHLYIHNNPNKHTVDFYCYLCNESIIVNLYCLE